MNRYLRCALLLKKILRIGCQERRSFPGAWNSGPAVVFMWKDTQGVWRYCSWIAYLEEFISISFFVQVFVGCWNSKLFWCLCVWHLCQTLFTKFQNPAEVRTQARCDKSLKPRPVLQPRPVVVADSLWIIPLDSKADKLTKIEKDLEEVAVDMFAYLWLWIIVSTFFELENQHKQNARWKVL